MCISHVPTMCWALDVHLHIKSLWQGAEVVIVVLILQMWKLRLTEVKWFARFIQVVSGKAVIPGQPVLCTSSSPVGVPRAHWLPLPHQPLRCEDSSLVEPQVFSSSASLPSLQLSSQRWQVQNLLYQFSSYCGGGGDSCFASLGKKSEYVTPWVHSAHCSHWPTSKGRYLPVANKAHVTGPRVSLQSSVLTSTPSPPPAFTQHFTLWTFWCIPFFQACRALCLEQSSVT